MSIPVRSVARYAVLRDDGGEIDSITVEVPYDRISFLESYKRLAVAAREFVLPAFHGIRR